MGLIPSSAEHLGDSTPDRAAMRRNCLAARQALDAARHAALSSQLSENLLNMLTNPAKPVGASPIVAFCLPMRGEFDPQPVVTSLLARGWRAAVPVVVERDAPMVYRFWTPHGALDRDILGLPVPALDERASPDVVLLPLVAFDAAGYRLGYGGGYFDRTLAAQHPTPWLVGVGFEMCRVRSVRPQAHDIKLDAVVTEASVVYHSGSPKP